MSTSTKKASTPDNQPFDFNLDTVEAEVEMRPFRVHFDGRRWEFTHMEELDAWDLIENAERGDLAAVKGSMKLALGDQWAEFRKIPMPQWKLMPLFNAWRDHCGHKPGESPASES